MDAIWKGRKDVKKGDMIVLYWDPVSRNTTFTWRSPSEESSEVSTPQVC